MSSGCHQDLSQNSIQIEEEDDDRFFYYSRLLSKESSIANPSFRFYYGEGAAAVPFTWESQPGTPKCSFNKETTLPPLTPPPSYYSPPNNNKNPMKKNSRSNYRLLHILFPKMKMRKRSDHHHHVSSFPSSSSLSSSNSLSSSSNLSMFSTISPKKCRHRVWSLFPSTIRSSSFDSRADYYEEAEAIGSATSTLWFKACYGW